MEHFWEPWTPTIGQTVRVRLSGECACPRRQPSPGRFVEHYPAQDGMIGAVVAILDGDWPPHEPGHVYQVSLPEVLHDDCIGTMAGFFAACDLESVEEEAP